MICVGNKLDLKKEREVTEEEGQNFANKHNMGFMEVSASIGTNIQKLFDVNYIKCYIDIL